jgi:hypothetical protein
MLRTNETKEDFEHLRLLKAFLKIKDPALRRAIIELVERTAPLARLLASCSISTTHVR